MNTTLLASFNTKLIWRGKIIAISFITEKGQWMHFRQDYHLPA